MARSDGGRAQIAPRLPGELLDARYQRAEQRGVNHQALIIDRDLTLTAVPAKLTALATGVTESGQPLCVPQFLRAQETGQRAAEGFGPGGDPDRLLGRCCGISSGQKQASAGR